MVHALFHQALVRGYDAFKLQFPNEGRRMWHLRVLNDFWKTYTPGPSIPSNDVAMDDGEPPFISDIDPMDQVLEDEELGLVIRTDFTNDEAWNQFRRRLEESQKDLLQDLRGEQQEEPEKNTPGNSQSSQPLLAEGDQESDSSDEFPDFIKVIDPQSEEDRAKVKDISNIRALRLFNDVDIRICPPAPKETTKVPPNPLIGLHGLQEFYSGKNLWIYDSKSNADECVRVVSQTGDVYGTASGDSWRARGSHICELQFGMVYQGLRIDFNGLDRWDYEERVRNISECMTI
ncbi:hypothetical protein CVT24_004118 [Panaeolus cyanescens]|uniref:Uncharacterized protein n=1 Tax=Panaeolus cyanescens TaxID=181874 RepID=A0A409Y633_9AGAR|nr:hypothetical protein CVT24_004118 [Panaeolus cyanescens]